MTFAAASTIAVPVCMIDFEPPEPPPMASLSLSPCSSEIFSNGMPSRSLKHLRERRGVAHAEIERAGRQRHGAVGIEFDVGELLRRRRGDFEEIADAEPAQLAALAAFALALGKALAVGKLERLLGQRREIAAVVGAAGCGLVRQVARRDLIALAQRHAIDAHLDGGGVDQPLHVVVAFGPAGAAIGGDVRGVGEHAPWSRLRSAACGTCPARSSPR